MNDSLSLRLARAKVRVQYDWQHFSADTDMQQRYTLDVRNCFDVLGEENNKKLYTKYIKANEEAMEQCIPKRQRTRKLLQANHPAIVTARNRIHTKYSQSESPEDKREWKQAIECLYNKYDRLKEEELSKKIDRIEQANGDHKHG